MSTNTTYALVSLLRYTGDGSTVGKIEATGTYPEMVKQRVRGITGVWAVSKIEKVGGLVFDRHGNIETAIKN